jgi:enamine deaminase RidA (YjgF/YER057c/UK114 family)
VIGAARFALTDVVRARVNFRDDAHWPEFGTAHGERAGRVNEKCTFLRVAGVASPDWHVEVEAECVRT